MEKKVLAGKSNKINLVFELAGLSKTIEVSDIESQKEEKSERFSEGTTNVLFNILKGYLNQKYQIQAIRRKYLPIFLFAGSDFNGALEFPQRIKTRGVAEQQEGVAGVPYYFIVYLSAA